MGALRLFRLAVEREQKRDGARERRGWLDFRSVAFAIPRDFVLVSKPLGPRFVERLTGTGLVDIVWPDVSGSGTGSFSTIKSSSLCGPYFCLAVFQRSTLLSPSRSDPESAFKIYFKKRISCWCGYTACETLFCFKLNYVLNCIALLF